jgi:hypothetical protein
MTGIIADRLISPQTAPLKLPQSHGTQERNRVRGVKRNVATNPAIFGETYFGLTAPTTTSGIPPALILQKPVDQGQSVQCLVVASFFCPVTGLKERC